MVVTAEQAKSAERVGIAEAKASLSELVSRVEGCGEPFVIMRYNKPAAMVVPIPADENLTPKARGFLAACADPALAAEEQGAFARAMEAKHVHAS